MAADPLADLTRAKGSWLVTGAAGFIGSNLVETLLRAGQHVVGLDNFSTGYRSNLAELEQMLPGEYGRRFQLVQGDIRERGTCEEAVRGVDYVLHQAALGSVPRSLEEPLTSHDVNVTGFLNMLDAARREGVKRFIYAASSSTYGDSTEPCNREDSIGAPLSPYAATKLADEIYASVYEKSYAFKATGLRYFNVFGPRQDPDGAYAAVIPKWASAMIDDQPITINGDGLTSRDFCYVANAVQANILAALGGDEAQGQVYNVAVGARTSLLELFDLMQATLGSHQVHYSREPSMSDFLQGDVRHSMADIGKARRLLGYAPTHTVESGLAEAMPWYLNLSRLGPAGRH